jgi:hypothetical protein
VDLSWQPEDTPRHSESLMGATVRAHPFGGTKDFPLPQAKRPQANANEQGSGDEHKVHQWDGKSDERNRKARTDANSRANQTFAKGEDLDHHLGRRWQGSKTFQVEVERTSFHSASSWTSHSTS